MRKFLAKNGKPNPLEWAVPSKDDTDLEVRAWAIWEYSRELYSRESFAVLFAKKVDPEKCDAVFNINYAVFRTNAAMIIWHRLDTPWKALLPTERKKVTSLLMATAEAFDATMEEEAPCAFENGRLLRTYHTPFVDLPRGADVVRGRFAIDRAKGKERIVEEFERWLEKTCKVKARKRGRIDGSREWIHALANRRYRAAYGESIPVGPYDSGNQKIKDPIAPTQTLRHLKSSAAKADRIVAECVAIAEQILRESV